MACNTHRVYVYCTGVQGQRDKVRRGRERPGGEGKQSAMPTLLNQGNLLGADPRGQGTVLSEGMPMSEVDRLISSYIFFTFL